MSNITWAYSAGGDAVLKHETLKSAGAKALALPVFAVSLAVNVFAGAFFSGTACLFLSLYLITIAFGSPIKWDRVVASTGSIR